ncbi:ATP-binding cassette domain-containing protein [Azohydromonas lata]|uniref:ATP-binding cassette domain-containing protein n=1 Tax=Azohydromonas lata TaxID=45677 RepID=A0ABU5IHS7_9BURK|nr:ATP-binding cassette domain-containing protein [Azohydromonas lata]MDZ5458542.1 ATP-binding cassette domain-containing protein [Azohydromonas lata]
MHIEHFPLGGAQRAAFVPPEPAAGSAADFPPKRAAPRGAEVLVQHLGKRYGERTVLDDVCLRLAPGEFVAIVGRSGCGKSTLLRQVAGLERPDAGSLRVSGDADGQGTRIMFQDARLLPWKSVLDNVALGLPPVEGRKRARRALAQVGLARRSLEWPSVLSGGQRQRVALARALVHEPRLLLLDEPLGALDALTRMEMQQLIEELWREHGFTALLVTHDVSEAVALADRVVLIEEQRIALDERVPLPRPRNRAHPDFAAFEAHLLQRLLRPTPAERWPAAAAGAIPLRRAV